MQDWILLHTYRESSSDDQWYLAFAESLIPTLKKSDMLQSFVFSDYKDLALVLTAYLEDAVAEGGCWHRFKNKYQHLYERSLPFYLPDASLYYADEINREDVQFVIWSFLSSPQDKLGDDYIFIDPFATELLDLAAEVYALMNQGFEEAPVTDAQSVDWLMDMGQLHIRRKEMPSFKVEDCTSPNSRKFLTHTGGYPLAYFKTYEELENFFINILGWNKEEESLMPEMKAFENFILFANAKGILLAPEVAPYFKSDRNPLYDTKDAKSEGYVLFCEQGACPFDLLKYGMNHGYLDELQLPFPSGEKLLQENWDFIARWYLGEYYEGD